MIKFIKNLFSHKEIRFLFVGGINTCVGYGSYALFVFLGFNIYVCHVLSTIVGVINSYIWNRSFTFKSKRKKKEELPRFIAVYAISFLMGLLILNVLSEKLGMNPYLAGLINLVFTTLISWFGHKYFSFKEIK